MQKNTKGLVQITDLLEPPPLYNGLWGGGGYKKCLGTTPPPPIIHYTKGCCSNKSLRNSPFCKLM